MFHIPKNAIYKTVSRRKFLELTGGASLASLGAKSLAVGLSTIVVRRPVQAASSEEAKCCLLYTSPSPRDRQKSRMPSSA